MKLQQLSTVSRGRDLQRRVANFVAMQQDPRAPAPATPPSTRDWPIHRIARKEAGVGYPMPGNPMACHTPDLTRTPSPGGYSHHYLITPKKKKVNDEDVRDVAPTAAPTHGPVFMTPVRKGTKAVRSPPSDGQAPLLQVGGHTISLDDLNDVQTPKTPCSSTSGASGKTLGGSGYKPGKESDGGIGIMDFSPPKSDVSNPKSDQLRKKREAEMAMALAHDKTPVKSNHVVASSSSSAVADTDTQPEAPNAPMRKKRVFSGDQGLSVMSTSRRRLSLSDFFAPKGSSDKK